MSDKVVTLTLSPEFASFLESVHRQHKIDSNVINEPCVTLDPGETTGVAVFDGDTTIRVYQQETKEIGPAYDWLYETLEQYPLESHPHLRYEDYRVYEWKSADHSWSQIHTLRWIGAILVAVHHAGWDHSSCMAQHAKGFWTDEKLKHFGLYTPGLKHGRDALRHLLYFLLFPTKAG